MRARRALPFVIVCAALSLRTGAARAAPPVYADAKGEAQVLFDEGLRLFDAKDYKAACEKFSASQRAEAAAATLLNLGRCYDAGGKPASARKAYAEAVTQARTEHDEPRAKVAKQKESDVAVLVPHIKVEAVSPEPDLRVECDGELVIVGAATELDPGTHTITATAAGKKTFTTSLVINAAETKRVTIPALESGAAAPEAKTSPGPLALTPRRTIALAVGGAGVIAAGIGAFFGVRATSLQSDAEDYCTPQHVCTAQGVDLTDRAGSAADTSTVAFILGGALLAGAVVLWVTAPEAPGPRVSVGTSGTGLWLGATY